MTTSPQTLVVLGCSATKFDVDGQVPAVHLYDGPVFRVLRSHLRSYKWPSDLSVGVLSAKYGFVGAVAPIKNYDQCYKLSHSPWYKNSIRSMEARGSVGDPEPKPDSELESDLPTIEESFEQFLHDARKELSPGRIKKYALLFHRMKPFARVRGLHYLDDLTPSHLADLRNEWSEQWNQGQGTICLNIQMLRRLFRVANKRGWAQQNPTKELEMPKAKGRRPSPFTVEEMRRIFAAVSVFEQRAGSVSARRLYAFVLLLRYSGMRIGDAVRCEVNWIQGSRISFYSQKTNVHVCNRLPDEVIQILKTVPLRSDRHFFWTGASTLHSAVGKWQRRLQILFGLAGIRGGHAHRFRHTYAHDMTHDRGMTLEELKQALGHLTTRTTERFYSHWLKERQDRLEAKQELAWAQQSALPALGGKEDRPI
jgi:integrase